MIMCNECKAIAIKYECEESIAIRSERVVSNSGFVSEQESSRRYNSRYYICPQCQTKNVLCLDAYPKNYMIEIYNIVAKNIKKEYEGYILLKELPLTDIMTVDRILKELPKINMFTSCGV